MKARVEVTLWRIKDDGTGFPGPWRDSNPAGLRNHPDYEVRTFTPSTPTSVREALEACYEAILDWEFSSQQGGSRGKKVADALFAAGDKARAALHDTAGGTG